MRPFRAILSRQPDGKLPTWAFLLGLFVVLYLLGVVLSLPSQHNYWFGDDTFLVRTYSGDELRGAWSGAYDASGASTLAYRPLTILYYHVVSLVFGENISLLRFFGIALLVLHVVLLTYAAHLLGLKRWQMLICGVLILCMRNTWFVLVWPTDTIRSFMVIFGDLTLILFLRALIRRQPRYFAPAILCFVVALFTREEILPYLVIIPAAGLIYAWQRTNPTDRLREQVLSVLRSPLLRLLILGAIPLVLITGMFWVIRQTTVPNAISAATLEGWLFNLMLVLFPRMPFDSLLIVGLSLLCFWISLIVMLVKLPARSRITALFWLFCVIVASSLGVASARANNLLLPIGFFSLFLATMLGNFGQRSRPVTLLVSGILILFIVGSAIANQTAQLAITPTSTAYLDENMELVWGRWSYLPTPDVRREEIARQLGTFGMTPENFRTRYQQIYEAALSEERHYPTMDGTPYVPLTNWLHGW